MSCGNESNEEKATLISNKVRAMKSELILDAALTVFSRKGVAEATLEDIAQEVGFSKASIYNYYPNKERIIYNLTIREWENFLEQLFNSPEFLISPEQSFEENLRRYMLLQLKTFVKHFHFIVSVNLTEVFKSEDKDKDMLREFIEFKDDLYKRGLLKIYLWAKDKDEIGTMVISSLPESSFCRMIDGTILGVVHEWIYNQEIGNVEEAVDFLVYFIINGIGKK